MDPQHPQQQQVSNPGDNALSVPSVHGNPGDEALEPAAADDSLYNLHDPASLERLKASMGKTTWEQAQAATRQMYSGLNQPSTLSAHSMGAGFGATVAPAILTAISPEAGILARLAAAAGGAFAGSTTGQAIAHPGAGVDIGQAVKDAAIVGVAPELVGAGAQKVVEGAGGLTKDLVNRMMGVGRKEVMFGKDPARTIINRIPIATDPIDLLDKVGDEMNTVAKEIESKVSGYTGKIDVKDAVEKPLAQARQDILNSTSTPKAKQQAIEELDGFEESVLNKHVLNSRGQVAKSGSRFSSPLDQLSPKDALTLKRLVGDNVNWQSSGFPNDMKRLQMKTYAGIRQAMEQAIPDIKASNQEYADLAGAKQALQRKTAQQATGKSGIGMRDIAAGGLGELAGGGAGAAAAVAAKKAAESTPGSTAMAKVVKSLADSDFKHLIPAVTRLILGAMAEAPGPDSAANADQNAK